MAIRLGRFSIEKLKVENLYAVYLGMNPREQTISLVAAAITLLLVLILPVMVASTRISRLETDVSQGRDGLRQIMRAIEGYDKKSMELKQLQKSIGGGFDSSISTTLESIAENIGIKDQIDSLKEKSAAPSDVFDESSVDVRLKRVSLKQLIDYLHAIESNQNSLLRLKNLSVKSRFDNKRDMDATFSVSTYRLLEGTGETTGEGT